MTRLALTRREWETIVIDGPCTITIVQIWRGHVRLTVEADPSVTILRGELVDRQDRFADEERIRKQAGYET